jgi:hypothetical protein
VWLRVVVVAAAESEWDVGGSNVGGSAGLSYGSAKGIQSPPQQYACYIEVGCNIRENPRVLCSNLRNYNCSEALYNQSRNDR